jgi:tetratricopeptide (TPR) repeat protein
MSKKFVVVVLLCIATVFVFTGASLFFSENTTAQDEPTCYLTQPSGGTVDLTEVCVRQQEAKERQNGESKEMLRLSRDVLDHMQKGQFQSAINKLTQVININPNLPEVYYERGTMYVATNNSRTAIADFQKAASLYRASGDLYSADSMQQLIEQIQRELL